MPQRLAVLCTDQANLQQSLAAYVREESSDDCYTDGKALLSSSHTRRSDVPRQVTEAVARWLDGGPALSFSPPTQRLLCPTYPFDRNKTFWIQQ